MSDSVKTPSIKNHLEQLENQLDFFSNNIKESKKIEAEENSQEEERARILAFVDSQKEKLSNVREVSEKTVSQSGSEKTNLPDLIARLEEIDDFFAKLKMGLAEIVENQYACKLEGFKKEIFITIDLVLDDLDFIIPNIRHEIEFLEKTYRIPANAVNTIFPALSNLVNNLENHKITFREFLEGYGSGENKVHGYNELRSRNGIFSKFQFYENLPEKYKEIHECLFLICKTMEPFLQKEKSVPDFGKFLLQIREKDRKIARMADIFENEQLISSMIKKAGKKYSYCEEVTQSKALANKFLELQKPLIVYNERELKKAENDLASLMKDEADKTRLSIIMEEAHKHIKEKTLPFERIEIIFSKLLKKDFNIVIREKTANDITIAITSHHENKYGKDLLERTNTIIMEIDFWYPLEKKQLLFQSLAGTTEKIQADEPIDKGEFVKLMQSYDQEIENHLRATYPDKIKSLKIFYSAFQKTFAAKTIRDKLEKRLVNKEIWGEINPRLSNIKRALLVLDSGNQALEKHVNKFPFIRNGTEELCQLLYDLSMQLFVLYPGVDGPSVSNMANLLSVYNDHHDHSSLWAAFSHYFNKLSISNWNVKEKLIINLTKKAHCKAELKKLFPDHFSN